MNATQEVREQYKQAVREYLNQSNEFNRGRMSGLATSLGCLGVSMPKIDEMCHTCEEQVKDERANEDIGPGDVSYDEEGFVIKQKDKLHADRRAVELATRQSQDFGPRAQAEEVVTEQEELDAIERPVSQAKVEKESEEDIYECEHCNAEFRESEILYHKYGGEIGTIAFCPRCKQATKLICVSDIVEARKAK